MDCDSFVARVAGHPDLELIGASEEAVFVANARTRLTYSLTARGVLDAPEDQLFAVLEGARNLVALEHWSRIVGYFSQIEHWNKGKLGELKDRRAAKAFYSEGLELRLDNDKPLGRGGAPQKHRAERPALGGPQR